MTSKIISITKSREIFPLPGYKNHNFLKENKFRYNDLVVIYEKTFDYPLRGYIKKEAMSYKIFNKNDFPRKKRVDQTSYCKIPSCGKISNTFKMCWRHYKQYRKGQRTKSGKLLIKVKKYIKNKGLTCKYTECEFTSDAKGFCSQHYTWFRSGTLNSKGKLLRELRFKNKGNNCKVKKCPHNATDKGFCTTHYALYRQGFVTLEGKLERRKINKINRCKYKGGCPNGKLARGFCQRHYSHFRSGIIDVDGNQLRELMRNYSS